MYKRFIRPILFKFSPEKAHFLTFLALKFIRFIPFVKLILKQIFSYKNDKLRRQLWGLNFENPIGLAAGLDKNAEVFNELACFGFGFIEVGTVTPLPQKGNPKPRLFRLIEDFALINRMGFNNKGIDFLVKKLKNKNDKLIIGGNIGKNTLTPNVEAVNDYCICFKKLYPLVDYLTINVSCPNVQNLRDLQHEDSLEIIIQTLIIERAKYSTKKPIFIKISPDSNDSHLDTVILLSVKYEIDGIIATNTTVERDNLITKQSDIESIGKGGLSGKPIFDKSNQVIKYIVKKSEGKIPVIASGGVFSGADALEKLNAGACLVQIYTSFIYEGPKIVKEISKYLAEHIKY